MGRLEGRDTGLILRISEPRFSWILVCGGSLCLSTATRRDKSREWNVSKQKWNLCSLEQQWIPLLLTAHGMFGGHTRDGITPQMSAASHSSSSCARVSVWCLGYIYCIHIYKHIYIDK